MSHEKPGFWRRLFGGGSSPEPAEKEPPKPAPSKKEPGREPARREPSRQPEKKEPPAKRVPKVAKKQAEPASSATAKEPKTEPAHVGLKGHPPAGPATVPGARPPEERMPGTRKKGSPDDKPPRPKAPRKPRSSQAASEPKMPEPKAAQPRAAEPKPADTSTPAPPPAGPHETDSGTGSAEEGESDEDSEGPTAPAAEPPDSAAPEAPAKAEAAAPEAEPRRSWYTALKQGLARSSNALGQDFASILSKRRLDAETLDELEEVLIRADLGVEMADRIRNRLSQSRHERGLTADELREILADEIAKVLEPVAHPLTLVPGVKPNVILIVGVNGTGKTTTAAKLAHHFIQSGANVLLAAADTFRAAAIDQLKVWGGRAGAEVVAREVGADPAGVAYEALERARAEGKDLLLIDTAGRLHNKSDLMAELAKILRVMRKLDPSAPHGVVLVLDATTGQNALNQVATFKEVAGVTGLVVTKLDGSARGGILVAIAERFGLPINAIGVGEGMNDLEAFDAASFARAIAGIDEKNAAAA